MESELRSDVIYQLKIVVLGDRGVGKSSIVQTYLQGRLPIFLPLAEDIAFYSKKEEYSFPALALRTSRKAEDTLAPVYECRMHLWDLAGSACSRQTLLKFRREKFFSSTSAILYIFNNESSFQHLRATIIPNLPRLQINNKQSQFMIYNCFTKDFSRKLDEQAEKQSRQQMTYLRIHQLDVKEVQQLFQNILKQTMFKIQDGIITNAVMKDKDNKVVLKNNRGKKEEFTRKYNRCC